MISHNELVCGYWGRISPNGSVASSPPGNNLEILVGGVTAVSIVFNQLNSSGSGGIVITSNFNYTIKYFNGSVFIATNILNPFSDPIIGTNFPTNQDRSAWATHTYIVRLRTSDYDDVTGLFSANGELEVRIDNVAVLNLSGITIARNSNIDQVTIKHAMDGDFVRPWLMNGQTIPTVDINGNLSSITGLIYFDDFSLGDRSN